MRLIDADALKETLIDKVFANLSDEFYGTMQALDEAPTIKAWTRADHNADAFHAYVEGKKSATKRGKWQGIGRTAVTGSLC